MNLLGKSFSNKFADAKTKVLRICQETGKVEKLESLLVRKPNLNLNELRYDGFTPLHVACIYDQKELVKYLISNCQMDIHAVRDRSAPNNTILNMEIPPMIEHGNCTVFHMVCFLGDAYLARLLIEQGAKMSAVTKNGYNCLHYACYNGDDALVKYLVNMHADATLKAQDGQTPLTLATKHNKLGAVMCLVESANVDVDAPGPDGQTALHVAAALDHASIVEYLLYVGADPTREDLMRKKAVDLCKNVKVRASLQTAAGKYKKSVAVPPEETAAISTIRGAASPVARKDSKVISSAFNDTHLNGHSQSPERPEAKAPPPPSPLAASGGSRSKEEDSRDLGPSREQDALAVGYVLSVAPKEDPKKPSSESEMAKKGVDEGVVAINGHSDRKNDNKLAADPRYVDPNRADSGLLTSMMGESSRKSSAESPHINHVEDAKLPARVGAALSDTTSETSKVSLIPVSSGVAGVDYHAEGLLQAGVTEMAMSEVFQDKDAVVFHDNPMFARNRSQSQAAAPLSSHPPSSSHSPAEIVVAATPAFPLTATSPLPLPIPPPQRVSGPVVGLDKDPEAVQTSPPPPFAAPAAAANTILNSTKDTIIARSTSGSAVGSEEKGATGKGEASIQDLLKELAGEEQDMDSLLMSPAKNASVVPDPSTQSNAKISPSSALIDSHHVDPPLGQDDKKLISLPELGQLNEEGAEIGRGDSKDVRDEVEPPRSPVGLVNSTSNYIAIGPMETATPIVPAAALEPSGPFQSLPIGTSTPKKSVEVGSGNNDAASSASLPSPDLLKSPIRSAEVVASPVKINLSSKSTPERPLSAPMGLTASSLGSSSPSPLTRSLSSSLDRRPSRMRMDSNDTEDDQGTPKPPDGAVALCWRICKDTGDVSALMRLLQQYPTLNAALLTLRDWDKWTPLLRASYGGHAQLVRYLFGRGASVSDVDRHGNNALHRACWAGHLHVVKLLIEEAEAEIDARDDTLGTPLHKAAGHGHVDVCRYLVQQGSDVVARNKDGFTPLLLAIQQGHEPVVELFVKEAGCDLSEAGQNAFGEGPFDLASSESMRVLLENQLGRSDAGSPKANHLAQKFEAVSEVLDSSPEVASSEVETQKRAADMAPVADTAHLDEPLLAVYEDEGSSQTPSKGEISESDDDITITSSVSAGPILMRDFEADLNKYTAFAIAKSNRSLPRPASTPPPYTEQQLVYQAAFGRLPEDTKARLLWPELTAKKQGAPIPASSANIGPVARQPMKVVGEGEADEVEGEEEEHGLSPIGRRMYFTAPSVTSAKDSSIQASLGEDGSLRITKVIPPFKAGNAVPAIPTDPRGSAFVAADLLSSLTPPETFASVDYLQEDSYGALQTGVTGTGGIGAFKSDKREPMPVGATKYMELVGVICKVIGRYNFQSLSRHFDQWKYSEVGGIAAVGGRTAVSPSRQRKKTMEDYYDDGEYDEEDAEEEVELETEDAPRIPAITAAQARNILRKLGKYPEVIKPLIRMNEAVLWAIFEHYCNRKQEIPSLLVADPDNKRFRKKLLTTEEIWNLLRDFGLCPELCGRIKLRELLVELGVLSSDKKSAKGKSAPKSRPFEREYGLPQRQKPVDVYDQLLAAQLGGVSSSSLRSIKHHYAMPLKRSVIPSDREKEKAAVFSAPVMQQTPTSSQPVLSFLSFIKLLWRITVECLEAPPPAGAPFRVCMLLRRMDSSQGRVKMTEHARDFKVLAPFKIPSDASALAMSISLQEVKEQEDSELQQQTPNPDASADATLEFDAIYGDNNDQQSFSFAERLTAGGIGNDVSVISSVPSRTPQSTVTSLNKRSDGRRSSISNAQLAMSMPRPSQQTKTAPNAANRRSSISQPMGAKSGSSSVGKTIPNRFGSSIRQSMPSVGLNPLQGKATVGSVLKVPGTTSSRPASGKSGTSSNKPASVKSGTSSLRQSLPAASAANKKAIPTITNPMRQSTNGNQALKPPTRPVSGGLSKGRQSLPSAASTSQPRAQSAGTNRQKTLSATSARADPSPLKTPNQSKIISDAKARALATTAAPRSTYASTAVKRPPSGTASRASSTVVKSKPVQAASSTKSTVATSKPTQVAARKPGELFTPPPANKVIVGGRRKSETTTLPNPVAVTEAAPVVLSDDNTVLNNTSGSEQ